MENRSTEHGCEFGRNCQASQCMARKYLREELDRMWEKINKFENRSWAVLVMMTGNLIGVVIMLAMKLLKI